MHSASSEIVRAACGAPELSADRPSRCGRAVTEAPGKDALRPHVHDAYTAHLHYCLSPVIFCMPIGQGGIK